MFFTFSANADNMDTEAVKTQNGEYIQNYETILKELCGIIDIFSSTARADMPEEAPCIDGAAGIIENVKYPAPEEASARTPAELLQKFGYTIRDINADGMPELIIGKIQERKNHSCFGSKIYAVYKQIQDRIYCILEGTNRNSFDILDNGTFFNLGSEGAAYTIFGSYAPYPTKKTLTCENFYFSHENDETFQVLFIITTHPENLTKKFQRSFQKRNLTLNSLNIKSGLNQFSLFRLPMLNPLKRTRIPFLHNGQKKILDAGTPYTEFIADNSDLQVKIAFSSLIGVKDFKVLKLELINVDENGKPSFEAREIYMGSCAEAAFSSCCGHDVFRQYSALRNFLYR